MSQSTLACIFACNEWWFKSTSFVILFYYTYHITYQIFPSYPNPKQNPHKKNHTNLKWNMQNARLTQAQCAEIDFILFIQKNNLCMCLP